MADYDYMFAYATNVSQTEMHKHCPNAVFRGFGRLDGYELRFSGYTGHAVATLIKEKNSSVDVAVYEMSPEDYYTIDNFEKFPYLYKREKVTVMLMGRKVKGSVYLMKQNIKDGLPSEDYLAELRRCFDEAGWSQDSINNALKKVENNA